MLYLDRVLLTRRIVKRQFPTIKGWNIEKVKERVKKERKANQLDNKVVTKGFKKGRVEPPIQINKEERVTPSRKSQPEKNE